MEPIRELTRKNVKWNWSENCERAFQNVKKRLSEAPILAYVDTDKEVVLQVDSSKNGAGAVLLQDGKPVEFASRALKSSERNWAQIEKEALSMLFGLERFDKYTYGRKVIVQNDHKPLAAMLSKPLSRAPKRLQDIMMKLFRYDIEFRFVKGVNLIIADALSRAYVCNKDKDEYSEQRPRIMSVNTFDNFPDARLQEVKIATDNDQDLQTLIGLIVNGWPEFKDKVPNSALPYFDMRDELSVIDGVIVKGEAVLIPKALRNEMKTRLHSSHLGYDSMIRRARGMIFWPGIASEIKQLAQNCEICQEAKPRNSRETLKQHDDGQNAWNKIGLDIFEIQGRNYLVAVDYYSNFIEVDNLTNMKSTQVIAILKKHFARYGIPTVIVSDNGPQFVSREFELFLSKWKIIHVTSSPGHQQSNGKAEAAVKIIKTMMCKTMKDGRDQFEALLELRNTPRQDTGLSPTEMMFGRKTQTMLPSLRERKEINQKRRNRMISVKKHHDKRARDLPILNEGQSVYFELKENEKWKHGQVVEQFNPRSYIVQNENGVKYRRNRIKIRPTEIDINIRERSPTREVRTKSSVHTDNSNSTVPQNSDEPKSKETVKPTERPKRTIKAPEHLKDFITY